MVRHAGAERVVRGAVRGGGARALLGFVRPASLLLAGPARSRRARFDRGRADASAARSLRQALELVGGAVDGLEVHLVLVLAPGRREIRVPALGHRASRELHVALVEGRLQLQQEHVALGVEDG